MGLKAEMNPRHDVICDTWRVNLRGQVSEILLFALLHAGWAARAASPATELCCCPQVLHGADVLLAHWKSALIHADFTWHTCGIGAPEEGNPGFGDCGPLGR